MNHLLFHDVFLSDDELVEKKGYSCSHSAATRRSKSSSTSSATSTVSSTDASNQQLLEDLSKATVVPDHKFGCCLFCKKTFKSEMLLSEHVETHSAWAKTMYVYGRDLTDLTNWFE